jgi:hypothetical protein
MSQDREPQAAGLSRIDPIASPRPAPGDSDAPFDPLDTEGSTAKKVGLGLLILFLLAGLVLLAVFFDFLRHWAAIHTGTIYPSNKPVYYNFWSGFGSDLGEATLIGAVSVGVYTVVRKANCHAKGCWRIGHYPLEGTPYHLCTHHHPEVPPKSASHNHILQQHHNYLAKKTVNRPGNPGGFFP